MSSDGAVGAVMVALALSFPVLLTAGAVSDLFRYLIPNWIALLLAILAVPALLLAGVDLAGLAWHLAVGLIVLVVASILFFRGLLGGGDAKLLAAAACWTGWPMVVPFVVYTAIAGGVLAIVMIVVRRPFRNQDVHVDWLSSLLSRNSGIPYGIAIAVGGWAIWWRLSIYTSAFGG
jgi:prepilin peptidase CpaA